MTKFFRIKRHEQVIYNLDHVFKIEKTEDEFHFFLNNGKVLEVKSSLVRKKIKKLFELEEKKLLLK